MPGWSAALAASLWQSGSFRSHSSTAEGRLLPPHRERPHVTCCILRRPTGYSGEVPYLRLAQAYMLISMEADTSTILGAVQAIIILLVSRGGHRCGEINKRLWTDCRTL